jgi:hypothetical protein
MIKGVLNTNEHKFGDNVNSFIKLVSFINLEYKATEVNDSDVVKKHLEIKFNGFKSINHFSKSLEINYNNAIAEIEETLLIKHKKYERYRFITNLILKFNDVQKLLINKHKLGFKHANFKISRAKQLGVKEIDESYCQEYYSIINTCLDKTLSYLSHQKDMQGIMNDSDIPLHKINIPAEDEPTKKCPLKFYQFLITKKGVYRLLQKFKPSKDDFSSNDIDYDDDSNTITYNHYDVKTGNYFATTLTFNDYFRKRLKAEYKKSQRLINKQFNSLKDEPQASFYLTRTLNDLKSLAKNVEGGKDSLGYADIKKVINNLINHFNTNYAVFITPGKTKTDKAYFFQLKGLREAAKKKAVNLHDSLVKNKFLVKNSRKDFINLFTGQQPLDRIIWLGHITQLKLFINLLISEDKIEKCKYGKWQITAANFKSYDDNFTNKQLNDTKLPVNKAKIIDIVSNISH